MSHPFPISKPTFKFSRTDIRVLRLICTTLRRHDRVMSLGKSMQSNRGPKFLMYVGREVVPGNIRDLEKKTILNPSVRVSNVFYKTQNTNSIYYCRDKYSGGTGINQIDLLQSHKYFQSPVFRLLIIPHTSSHVIKADTKFDGS